MSQQSKVEQLKRTIRSHKFTREEFPIPCVLPRDICDQIDALIDLHVPTPSTDDEVYVVDEEGKCTPHAPTPAPEPTLRVALERINHLATVELNGTGREYYIANRGDIAAESRRALEASAPAAAQPWVSVEERLPEPETRVLIWFNEGRIDGWRTRFGQHIFGHWRPEGANGNFDDCITHWMPLPAAPVSRKGEVR